MFFVCVLNKKIDEFKDRQTVTVLTVQDEEYHIIIKSNEYAAVIERE